MINHSVPQLENSIQQNQLNSPIELNQIINIIGDYSKHSGSYYYWQCPKCIDSNKDNLVYNSTNKHLNCFACGEGQKEVYKSLSNINTVKSKNFKTTNDISVSDETVYQCNQYLLENKELLKLLEAKRGINKNTVLDLKIGFSKDCNVWVIPNYNLENELIGFEFRPKEFTPLKNGSKSWRSKGKAKTLCKINKPINHTKTVILEGFLDAYVFYQILKKQGIENNYQILTSSNGVNFIPELIKSLDAKLYPELTLLLDNDTAGKIAIEKASLISEEPLYKITLPYSKQYTKDLTDWYLLNPDKYLDLTEQTKIIPLSVINKHLPHPANLSFVEPLRIKIDHYINYRGIIPYKNAYLKVKTEKKEDNIYLNVELLSNYAITGIKKSIEVDEDNLNNPENHCLDVTLTDVKNKSSKPINLSSKSKVFLPEFKNRITLSGDFIDNLKPSEFTQIFYKLYNENTIPETYCFKRPGLIKDKNLWLYKDCVIDLNETSLKTALKPCKNNVIEISNNTSVKLSENLEQKPVLNYSDTYTPQELANKLLNNILDSYSNSIEPLLIIGTCILSPFRDLFKEITGGFPICYLYGQSHGGKSNILNILTGLYGLNDNYISSGDSTPNSMWHKVNINNRIPAIYDEVTTRLISSGAFEGFLKSAYQGTKRERMKSGQEEDNTPVNTSLVLSSNLLPPQKDAIANRLILSVFQSDKFIVDEAKKFNEIRNNHLSSLLPTILLTKKEILLEMFNKNTKELEEINEYCNYTMSSRDINNLSIALTGIDLLFKIAKIEKPNSLITNQTEYIQHFKELYNVENPLDLMLNSLFTLKSDDKIKFNEDYKIEDNKLYLYYKVVYDKFSEYYRRTNGQTAPTKKEIDYIAKNDKRVLKDEKGSITANKKFMSSSRRCMTIDISNSPEFLNLL